MNKLRPFIKEILTVLLFSAACIIVVVATAISMTQPGELIETVETSAKIIKAEEGQNIYVIVYCEELDKEFSLYNDPYLYVYSDKHLGENIGITVNVYKQLGFTRYKVEYTDISKDTLCIDLK